MEEAGFGCNLKGESHFNRDRCEGCWDIMRLQRKIPEGAGRIQGMLVGRGLDGPNSLQEASEASPGKWAASSLWRALREGRGVAFNSLKMSSPGQTRGPSTFALNHLSAQSCSVNPSVRFVLHLAYTLHKYPSAGLGHKT